MHNNQLSQKTMEEFETPNKDNTNDNGETPPSHENGETLNFHDGHLYSDEFDSACSTPYVSAPSSPGRCGITGGGGFFYSAPASPMHFISSMTTSSTTSATGTSTAVTIATSGSFEFEFSARHAAAGGSSSTGAMSSADELFLNGKIRPMKLSTHLQRPQVLAPLLDLDENNGEDEDDVVRGRDLKLRSRSLRRRTRSMSPLRTTPFQWLEDDERDDAERQGDRESTEANIPDLASKNAEMIKEAGAASTDTTPSASSSRSSSVGRNSKRWVFLKEFLYRSKSEGRNNGHKFWSTLSFSPVKDKKTPAQHPAAEKAPDSAEEKAGKQQQQMRSKKVVGNRVGNRGAAGRRVGLSAHELHYTANRAQAEEMRRKTFLPYRQGLLGCLGFSSKSYGAMNGFARALNPVSSR